MACTICCYTREDCGDCSECLCECRCGMDEDDGEPCLNCGSPGCPGYCNDYQTYNLRDEETCQHGWPGHDCGQAHP
jgi:hypothetical protein